MSPPFAEYTAQIENQLKHSYGIPVIMRDFPAPFIGDLDGAAIHIDKALAPEERLFLLGHLFGHTVQWNVSPQLFELVMRCQPPVDEAFIPTIIDYEQEAAAYGLSLFHQINIRDIDEWFSEYTARDQAYLLHYYRTGQKRDFQTFSAAKVPVIKPKRIPLFTPTGRVSRLNGVVI